MNNLYTDINIIIYANGRKLVYCNERILPMQYLVALRANPEGQVQ